MANQYTTIADIVANPGLLGNAVANLINYTNPFLASGVAVTSPVVNEFAGSGANVSSIKYIKPLDATRFNVSTDAFATKGEVSKISAAQFMAARHNLNNGFAFTDLQEMVTGFDAEAGVVGGLAVYWNKVMTKIAIDSIKGALAGETALISGDGTDPFSADLVIDASTNANELGDSMRTLLVSYATRNALRKGVAGNTYVTADNKSVFFDEWNGYRIIAHSSITNTASILCANGALAFGQVTPQGLTSLAIDRDESAGTGGGGEVLWSRRSLVAHPQGFNYVPDAADGPIVDSKDMADGTRWTKALDDDQIPFRLISHTA